jgi:hypothetical protein
MTDEEIRQLLLEIDGVSGQWRNEKCVLRDRVVQRGGDGSEVDAWVRRIGGRIERYVVSRTLPAHLGQQPVPEPWVYIVPLSALADPRAS